MAAGLVACSVASQAAVVFSDDFDASVSGLTVVPTGWTVSDGTVDVVSGGFCVAGQCVDLDGSTGNAGDRTGYAGGTRGGTTASCRIVHRNGSPRRTAFGRR